MTRGRITKSIGLSALAIVLAATSPTPSEAQVTTNEIKVTARKREESLQDVPLSVTAFGIQGLRDRNIQNIYDVALFTPNFTFTRNLGRRLDAPNIRGQFSPLLGQANASFFVDGVFVSGDSGGMTIDNLERVEILRGPQAAIFGRATFAGAVNFITRKPSNEFEAEFNGKVANHDDYKASFWASGPLIEDKVLFFASANFETYGGEWQNGLLENEVAFIPFVWPTPPPTRADTTQLGGEETWDVTGKLVLRPFENLEINLKASHSESEDDHFPALLVPVSDLNCFLPGTPGAGTDTEGWFCGELEAEGLVSKLNLPNMIEGVTNFIGTAAPAPFVGAREESQRYLAEGILDLGEWAVTGRATYNKQESQFFRDLDRSPALGPASTGLFESGEIFEREDYSFEARVASPQEYRIRGFIGGYYYKQEVVSFQRDFTGFSRLAFGAPVSQSELKNWAVFGSIEWDVTDKLTGTFEARYAEDTPMQVAVNGVTATDTFKSFSPRITINYQPTDEMTIYALAARGNKPGGFNFAFFDSDVPASESMGALADGRAVVEEEKSWTYEAGAKTTWLDGRLLFNGAFFYVDWTNQAINQVQNILTFAGPEPNSIVVNAGKSRVWGIELETSFSPVENLTFDATYGLASTKLQEFNSGDIAQLTGFDDPFLLMGGNAVGQEAPRVPKHSANFAATYSHILWNDIDWFARTDVTYESKKWASVVNQAHTGDMYIWNFRAGLDAENWTLTGFVDNLLDDDTPTLIQDFPNFDPAATLSNGAMPSNFVLTPRRGRSFGLLLQFRL